MTGESGCLGVRELARLKRDRAFVSFGFSPARGNQNYVVIGMIVRAANIDPKTVKIAVH